MRHGNNLNLKNVVVSFQTLKTAKWRSNGTEKINAPASYAYVGVIVMDTIWSWSSWNDINLNNIVLSPKH